MRARGITRRELVRLCSLSAALALAGCAGETGALVTFTLSDSQMSELRGDAGLDGEVVGELFVARGRGGVLVRDVIGASDSISFDDDATLIDGFTVRINDEGGDGGEVTVALAVWAEDGTGLALTDAPLTHYFVARTVAPTGALRQYVAPLAYVDGTTRRRLDCDLDPGGAIEPEPDGAMVWWGGTHAGPDACIGWMQDGEPTAIVIDPEGDPDCDGAPGAIPEACQGAGQRQCWSNVGDYPGEDVDDDGHVADTAGGDGWRLAGPDDVDECIRCTNGDVCECAPGDGARFKPEPVPYCSDDVCELPEQRRCVSSDDINGGPCLAGWYDCDREACEPGDADVVGMACDEGSLAIDCPQDAACESDDVDAVSFVCHRAADPMTDEACPWRGEIGVLLALPVQGESCHSVSLWGDADFALEVWGHRGDDEPPGPLDGSETDLICSSITLISPGGGQSDGGYVLLEVGVLNAFGVAQTYVVPIEIADGDAGNCNVAELQTCVSIF